MGSKPAYAEAARQLGHALASRNLGLVYGGTDVGTMGELANAALEGGGEVIGVVPSIFVERQSPTTRFPIYESLMRCTSEKG